MTTAHDVVDEAHERTGRLSPADVQSVLFTRAGLGRRGYDEGEVDLFLERVQTELSRLLGEKVSLRDEVTSLRSRPADGGQLREEASVQAVKVLSAAQLTADQYVADAESYSKRISSEARERYERMVEESAVRAKEIVEEAEKAAAAAQAEADSALAAAAAAAAAAESGDAGSGEAADDTSDGATEATEPTQVTQVTKAELEQQVAYLRTFSQVCRVQLRAYLEALISDVELEWGRADPGVVTAPPRQPRSERMTDVDAGTAAEQDGAEQDGAAQDGAAPVQQSGDDRSRDDEALLRH